MTRAFVAPRFHAGSNSMGELAVAQETTSASLPADLRVAAASMKRAARDNMRLRTNAKVYALARAHANAAACY